MKNMMARLRERTLSKRGQNTVEYLLMLGVVVAVVLIAGKFMKDKMPGLMNQIMSMISGAANTAGSTGG